MKYILIGGYYGAGNLGDEAILECMLKDFRTQRTEIDFIVTSWDPCQTSKHYNVQAIHWQDLPALIEAGQKSSLIILGGGGIFQDYWGINTDTYLRKSFRDITSYGSLPLLANLLGKPCMIYAVGIGPFKNSEALQHTRFAFENSIVSTLRDRDSLDLLRTSGNFDENIFPEPLVTADPVFTLETNEDDDDLATKLLINNNIDPNADLIAVVLRHWDPDGTGLSWLEDISDGLNKFLQLSETFQVVLLSFQNNELSAITNDWAINKKFQKFSKQYKYQLIKEQLTPRTTQAIIKRCSLVLGMRLHSLIMGINSNTPIVGISYDPKVSSLMKSAGLKDYCYPRYNPGSEDVATKLELAWKNQDQIKGTLSKFQEHSRRAAKENTRLAIDLISESPPPPRKFFQQFPIEQIKLINNLDSLLEISSRKNLGLNSKLDTTQAELIITLSENSGLNSKLDTTQTELKITLSKNSELISKQNSIQAELEKTIIDKQIAIINLENALEEIKNKIVENQLIQVKIGMLNGELKERNKETKNIRSQLDKIYFSKIWKLASFYYFWINKFKSTIKPSVILKTDRPDNSLDIGYDLCTIIKNLNSKVLNGVFIVTSTLPFDELYNQRVINLSKYLSNKGYGVIYVAWRWTPDSDAGFGKKQEVYKNVFQIPIDIFLSEQNSLDEIHHKIKYYVVEFPHPELFYVGLKLRKLNFVLAYEIIDDWESFHQEGQAIWFNPEIEKSLVLNSNVLTAVSPPLVSKFSNIRNDIVLIPNGYDPNLLGYKNAFISRVQYSSREINIGYFGHLTDSWFDWNFLFCLIDLSVQNGFNLKFHLIGYGEPELPNLEKYKERIFLHGRVDPSKLYRHVNNWDLAMIPFKNGKLAEAVDPIKLYEYLFFGLPVLVKGIPHLSNHPFVKLVTSEVEFLDAIPILRNLTEKREENMELTKVITDATWDNRFNLLIQTLESDPWMFL